MAIVNTADSEERIRRMLLVTTNVVPSSPIFFSLMMDRMGFSEMSTLTRPTRLHNSEDDILHSQRRENLKSYKALTSWTL
jgi:hypothetical protein